ncbi:MAG: hypothetical protein ACP5QG_00130 [candidate division WOR-3 bacterium]
MRIKISLEPTGNFWIDNGKVQVKRLKCLLDLEDGQEIEFQETVDKLVNKCLVKPTGNKGEFYNSQTGKLESYEKMNWVDPANVFIKITPRTKAGAGKTQEYTYVVDGKKKTVLQWEHQPFYRIEIKLTKERGPCIFCGDNTVLVDLKQYLYPFLVEPGKFSNFYPSLKGAYQSCPMCALAGVAAFLGTLYRRQGDNLHMFIFHSDDLGFLSRFLDTIRPIIASEESKSKATNFSTDFFGEGLHETMLGFLFYVFSKLYEQETSKQVEEVFSLLLGQEKSVRANLILMGISGQTKKGFNMTGFTEFSKLEPLYRLYRSWRKGEVDPSQIIKQFMTKEGKSWNSIWREQVARGITDFSEIAQPIEDFLYMARIKEDNPYPIKDLSQFLSIYHQEVLKMDEDTIKLLAWFGHSLGSKCREENEMGLLYSLRNAKNVDDYLKTLNDIQFRLEMTTPEDIIRIEKGEKIAGQPWQRIKTLLSIYAMNSFLWKGSEKKEEK